MATKLNLYGFQMSCCWHCWAYWVNIKYLHFEDNVYNTLSDAIKIAIQPYL